MKITIIIIPVLLVLRLDAQNPKGPIFEFINDVRAGKDTKMPSSIDLPESAPKILNALQTFESDTSIIVRSTVYNILHHIGARSKTNNIRERVVLDLLHAIRDKNSANAAAALQYLTTFYLTDFSKAAKDTLRNIYKSHPTNFNKVIMLVGFVQLQELKPSLNELVQNTKASKQDRWAARIALARLGDGAMTSKILEKVKGLEVNDDLIYDVVPDLIYTRQPEVIAYLVEILKSDALNCSSAGGESTTKIPCGYRVMEALAPVIKDYPLKLDASGDINTKDYASALKTVRAWFNEHKSYSIITNTY